MTNEELKELVAGLAVWKGENMKIKLADPNTAVTIK